MKDVVTLAGQIMNVNNLGSIKVNMQLKEESWKKEKGWLKESQGID